MSDMKNYDRDYERNLDRAIEDQASESELNGCPRCGSLDVAWQGGDTVVNLGGAATFTHVNWYTCEECGHKWSESEDYG